LTIQALQRLIFYMDAKGRSRQAGSMDFSISESFSDFSKSDLQSVLPI